MDRWGRSVTDLLATLQEMQHLGVGFVSLTEALDLTTPAGRAMAGLLAVLAEYEREILRERVRAGLAHARQNGQRLGRPLTAALHPDQVRKFHFTEECRAKMEDLAVGSRVRAKLALNPSTSHLEFEVTARRGRISLQGKLTCPEEFEEVRRVVQAVPGVVELDLDALSMPLQG